MEKGWLQMKYKGVYQRLNWSGWFLLVNGAIALLIGLRYLSWAEIQDSVSGLYLTVLYLAQFPALALLTGIPWLFSA